MEDCSTDERLQQETLCHRQWTDEYVERPETLMRQKVVVVWLERLLVDVEQIFNRGSAEPAESKGFASGIQGLRRTASAQ